MDLHFRLELLRSSFATRCSLRKRLSSFCRTAVDDGSARATELGVPLAGLLAWAVHELIPLRLGTFLLALERMDRRELQDFDRFLNACEGFLRGRLIDALDEEDLEDAVIMPIDDLHFFLFFNELGDYHLLAAEQNRVLDWDRELEERLRDDAVSKAVAARV
jgi:hypothetical protein